MRKFTGLRFLFPRSAVLLLPLLMGSKGGCGKPDGPPTVEEPTVHIQPVSEPLQVVSMEPGFGVEGQPTEVTVLGGGFEEGVVGTLGNRSLSFMVLNSNSLTLTVPALPVGSYDLTLTNPKGGQSTLRRAFSVSSARPEWDCSTLVLNFDTDTSTLGDHGHAMLNENNDCYQSMRSITVEGHTDQRGTTSYNLALGQRRSDAVLELLVRTGVSEGQIRASSLGEERPLSFENTASAWAQNRRVEIHAK